MSEAIGDLVNPSQRAALKLPEPEVPADDPWSDDELGRNDVAARLTDLVRDMRMPLVVSIDGDWGTGKTFFLKRWQADLEIGGCRAIYFNAWEDDFCDDPLLAILGQLDASFRDGRLGELASRFLQVGGRLLLNNLTGVFSKTTGLQFEVDDFQTGGRVLLQKYQEQAETKREAKESLADLANHVAESTGFPLVFIIDELDRCRPTFALELLERVKHVFDVPNMVFVFGINRTQLCEALRSVYGGIDTDAYLRRFFDLQFALTEANTAKFARLLMKRYELESAFQSLNSQVEQHAFGYNPLGEYQQLQHLLPSLWDYMGMTLRDVDHCVRLLALLIRNLEPGKRVYPTLAGLYITLKFKNPELYRRMVDRSCSAAEIMDYIESEVIEKSQRLHRPVYDLDHCLEPMEVWLCCVVDTAAAEQLTKLSQGTDVDSLGRLPERTKRRGPKGATKLVQEYQRESFSTIRSRYDPIALAELPILIDLYHEVIR